MCAYVCVCECVVKDMKDKRTDFETLGNYTRGESQKFVLIVNFVISTPLPPTHTHMIRIFMAHVPNGREKHNGEFHLLSHTRGIQD